MKIYIKTDVDLIMYLKTVTTKLETQLYAMALYALALLFSLLKLRSLNLFYHDNALYKVCCMKTCFLLWLE